MVQSRSVLLLAGSSEARHIAAALVDAGCTVRALKTEPPRGADPMPVPFEVVPEVTPDYLRAALGGVDVVVDASHGFDAALSEQGHAVAAGMRVPILTFRRAPWDVAEHPRWRSAPDVAQAMTLIGPGARVFSATGWASLPDCAAFPGTCLMLRQTARHDRPPPFDFVELVFGDPPFTVADETALFRARQVDLVMCRNLGGRASRPKLDAAIALDLGVILIDRPALPAGVRIVDTVDAVVDWVTAR